MIRTRTSNDRRLKQNQRKARIPAQILAINSSRRSRRCLLTQTAPQRFFCWTFGHLTFPRPQRNRALNCSGIRLVPWFVGTTLGCWMKRRNFYSVLGTPFLGGDSGITGHAHLCLRPLADGLGRTALRDETFDTSPSTLVPTSSLFSLPLVFVFWSLIHRTLDVSTLQEFLWKHRSVYHGSLRSKARWSCSSGQRRKDGRRELSDVGRGKEGE